MAMVEVNDYLLKQMKSMNSNLNEITYNPSTNIMSYKGHEIDLGDFNIQEIFHEYSQLYADLEVMNPNDLFNAIAINAALAKKEKDKVINNEESIEQIKQINPRIVGLNKIKKQDEFGQEKNYIYIITEDGAQHILYDSNPKDVMVAFHTIAKRNGGNYNNITENDLYNELKRSMDDLSLVDSKDAQTRNDLSDDFKNKLTNMESYNSRYANNDGTRVVGNNEHDIYIQNSQVVTFDTDDKGNIIRENHEGATFDSNGESLSNDSLISDTNQNEEPQEDNIVEIEVSKLIDVEEYIKIVESPTELTEEEQDKISYFDGFMSELYIYQDYLGDTATSMWNKYEHYIILLANNEILSEKQSNEIDFYNNLQDSNKKVELKNAEHKALILEYKAEAAKKQSRQESIAGTVNALFIIEITTFISICIAALIFFLAK